MPRVTDEHLAARRQQILDAAQACFGRNGFHHTSMQDVINEAELSVGAVYRYFASKQELITAIAENNITGVDDILAEIPSTNSTPSLIDAMDRALEFVDARTGPNGVLRIALQVWSESVRDPNLAAFIRDKYSRVRSRFVTLATSARDAGELPPDADVEGVGSALFGTILGYALQRMLSGSPDRETYLAGIRALISR